MCKRRRRIWLLASVLGVLCAVILGFWAAASGGSEKGSPVLAAKWKDELNQYSTPDEAKAKNRDVIVLEFQSGEWVFGLARSSHGMWKRGGGTVVLKDSNGQIRAFFGHVCGEGMLGATWEKTNLARFYQETLSCEFGFVEHSLP